MISPTTKSNNPNKTNKNTTITNKNTTKTQKTQLNTKKVAMTTYDQFIQQVKEVETGEAGQSSLSAYPTS